MRIVALAGGVGAAKLLSGLVAVLSGRDLVVVVNTGDDFEWMGLYVCPDLDTVTYTLAGIANPDTGWGIRSDTFHLLSRLGDLGCETWFQLGDGDLATHLYRSHLLREGASLTEVTRRICAAAGVDVPVLPMTDSRVPTLVHTEQGTLPFQDYFVRLRCTPRVTGFSNASIASATPAPGVMEAIDTADAILICPSNPFISIGPILAVPGIRGRLRSSEAKILAVAPIVAGRAVKGPAAQMLEQTGAEVSAFSVARMYEDVLDIFLLDHRDRPLKGRIESLGLEVRMAETLMETDEKKVALARTVLDSLG